MHTEMVAGVAITITHYKFQKIEKVPNWFSAKTSFDSICKMLSYIEWDLKLVAEDENKNGDKGIPTPYPITPSPAPAKLAIA